jgi:hypothetical protein
MAMDPRESSVLYHVTTRSVLMTPQEEDDEKAHLLCVDGTIFHTPKGGNVQTWTARGLDISVYA